MQDLNDVYAKMKSKKQERKELAKMFQDELKHNGEYQELVKQIKALREKKRSIEDQAKASAFSDAGKIDVLALEIKDQAQLLSDIAMTKFLNRETVEVVDEDVTLVPVFSVKFKKEEGVAPAPRETRERALDAAVTV
jgi:hypothetical protein